MNNLRLLHEKNFDKSRKYKPRFTIEDRNGMAIDVDVNYMSSIELTNLVSDMHTYKVCRSFLNRKKLYINIPRFSPDDKLVYIILEYIISGFIIDYDIEVDFRINVFSANMNTHGFRYSVLSLMAKEDINKEIIKKKIYFDINDSHYRRIAQNSGDIMISSNILSEIKTFFRRYDMPEDFKSKCATIVSELVDNALEHGHADCLVDIDVTDSIYRYKKEAEDYKDGDFWGINIVVANFSERLLGDDLKDKIKNHKYKNSQRYDDVNLAYNNHSKCFSKKYMEDDFFNITAFQESITGRIGEINSGGTGLTELIKSLQEYADENYCYMMSGNKGILFKKEYLEFNDDNWLGFNDSKDYINCVPDKDILFRSKFYFPGTGYNFMFAFKKDEES